MHLLGHYEDVPVQGTHRKARVYFPTLLKHVLISLAIFFVPFICIFSSASTLAELVELVKESFHEPIILVFFAIVLFLSLADFWVNRLTARDARRMRDGQLVARRGVLWAVGQKAGGRYPGPWRLVIDREGPDGSPLGDELYPLTVEQYNRHMEKYAQGGSGYAWLVELAVLPPLDTPEFLDPAPGGQPSPGDRFGFGQMPVSQGQIAEIFYLQQQPYGCYIGGRDLFPEDNAAAKTRSGSA